MKTKALRRVRKYWHICYNEDGSVDLIAKKHFGVESFYDIESAVTWLAINIFDLWVTRINRVDHRDKRNKYFKFIKKHNLK